MHGSPHDDRVMSLAIANQMLHYVWLPEYLPNNAPPKGSLLWFERFIPVQVNEKRAIGSFNSRR